MNDHLIVNVLGWVGLGCWGVCFWWMHRISSRQDSMLAELHEMTRRIEGISQAEHDMIREVHPQVGEIKEAVADVAADVADVVSSDRSRKTKS
jgi:hypothetical protein